MKAIPTFYKGRRYRSRLEAQWKAFFDLLGWQTEYEPIDFNGWIPDFVIIEAESVYVEVKPIDKVPPDRDVMDKIDQSGCDKEVLIVGITVPIQDGLIGWLRQDLSDVIIGSDEPHWAWAGAAVGVWVGSETNNELGRIPKGNRDRVFGFCHEEQSFIDRITGFYDGGRRGRCEQSDLARLRSLWAKAGNEVQWKRGHSG
jgi:hypothetical protein